MNFRVSNPQSAIRNPKSLRAFTMVEIALSLAIIGFALIAIIGVLPAGLSVQKDNREQTVINLDAAYLMMSYEAARSARTTSPITSYPSQIPRWLIPTAAPPGRWYMCSLPRTPTFPGSS
jgi:type II secretory pathway pseudopilin PulG